MKKKDIVLVLGGCRSGKSRYALRLAEDTPGNRKLFVATCIPQDEEMKKRVLRHQAERSNSWTTIEIPIDIHVPIKDYSAQADVILIDCLTIWVSNLMLDGKTYEQLIEQVKLLEDALQSTKTKIILVSNEVGCGIVPDNPLARQYRDMIGEVNQRIATCANTVYWVVAGIPVEIKKIA